MEGQVLKWSWILSPPRECGGRQGIFEEMESRYETFWCRGRKIWGNPLRPKPQPLFLFFFPLWNLMLFGIYSPACSWKVIFLPRVRGRLCSVSFFFQVISLGCACKTALPNQTQFCYWPLERITLPLLWERQTETERGGRQFPSLLDAPDCIWCQETQKLWCSREWRWQERLPSLEDGRAERRNPLVSLMTSLSYSMK